MAITEEGPLTLMDPSHFANNDAVRFILHPSSHLCSLLLPGNGIIRCKKRDKRVLICAAKQFLGFSLHFYLCPCSLVDDRVTDKTFSQLKRLLDRLSQLSLMNAELLMSILLLDQKNNFEPCLQDPIFLPFFSFSSSHLLRLHDTVCIPHPLKSFVLIGFLSAGILTFDDDQLATLALAGCLGDHDHATSNTPEDQLSWAERSRCQ